MKYKKVLLSIILALLVISGDITFLVCNKKDDKDNLISMIAEKKDFNIIDIKNIGNHYYLKYNKVDNATRYVVEILNIDEIISNVEVDREEAELTIPTKYLKNNETYTLNINAYSDDTLINSIEKEFIWEEPTFSASNAKSLKNKKYTLKIDGKLNNNRLVIKDGKKVLYDKKITKNKFSIPADLYINKNITLEFMLYSNDNLVSSFKASNTYKTTTKKMINKVSNVNIIKPSSYLSLSIIKDVEVEFTGGENAAEKNIYIYENNRLIKKESLVENKYLISSNTFKEGNMYKVIVEASKGKVKNSSTIYISTIKDGRRRMVELAKKQIGNSGKKFWTWWGFKGFVEWCAIFVSWVSDQNGYIEAGVIPKIKGCGSGVKWFKARNQFKLRTSGYVPQQGDIIFFDYHPENPIIDHVGIVEYSDGKYVYTIEGNTGDRPDTKALRKKYDINDFNIYGYGVPNY